MLEAGGSRQRIAGILNAAFAEGLLSEVTLSHRLGLLFGPPLVDPHGLVGDLSLRAKRPRVRLLTAAATALRRRGRSAHRATRAAAPLLLALDWGGGRDELVIGRAAGCDITLRDRSVSRRHARLLYRDGGWTIRDLHSTNGTRVNGVAVGRCRLRPGDCLQLGLERVDVD